MSEQLQIFFKKHHFQRFTIPSLAENILNDMKKSLSLKRKDAAPVYQPMIPVYGFLDGKECTDEKVIIIDAGGTNFRSALVTFSKDVGPVISELQVSSMPGIERELSKTEFYDAIADKIEYLRDSTEKIGFCFSYAMKMTKENDGEVLSFSKEIKAPEVVGTFVGKELLDVLKKRGWSKIKKIVMLNDTVAALLAGFSSKEAENMSSYIGFVFGTGINNAYIEPDRIEKIEDDGKKHIVVCECGMYNNMLLSTFDTILDNESTKPGDSLLEKMCSGAYMGKLAYLIIKTACEEHIFSAPFAVEYKKLSSLKAMDVDEFLKKPDDGETVLGRISKAGCITDTKKLIDILETVISRTASIITAVLLATLMKSGEGKEMEKPVCIVCNGSTFWKCHGLVDKVNTLLQENLRGLVHSYYKIVKIENDITIGTAVAAVRG